MQFWIPLVYSVTDSWHKSNGGCGLPYHILLDPKWRQWKDAPETVQLLIAECKMKAGKAYMEHHNQVAGMNNIQEHLCHGLEVPQAKWETPPRVAEGDRAKVGLWDFPIQTNKINCSTRPSVPAIFCLELKPVGPTLWELPYCLGTGLCVLVMWGFKYCIFPCTQSWHDLL